MKTARVCPAGSDQEQTSWSGFPGFGSKGPVAHNALKRQNGKFRITPRHHGSGRLCHRASATGRGHTIIRHPQPFQTATAGMARLAGTGGCREETQ